MVPPGDGRTDALPEVGPGQLGKSRIRNASKSRLRNPDPPACKPEGPATMSMVGMVPCVAVNITERRCRVRHSREVRTNNETQIIAARPERLF